jgi:hypothetical protein
MISARRNGEPNREFEQLVIERTVEQQQTEVGRGHEELDQ